MVNYLEILIVFAVAILLSPFAPAQDSFAERSVYFATHFRNWYEEASAEEVTRYVEELAEWGMNGVGAWFDMHDFSGMDDDGARRRLARIKLIFRTAQRLGLRRDLLFLANESFGGSPPELRADWRAGRNGYVSNLVGHYHVELCPSKPGATELLLKWRSQVFSAFKDAPPTEITIFPYDQGGCTCGDCAPWGANGFLKLAQKLSSLAKATFPGVRVNLSTWRFDAFGDLHEWDGVFARGAEIAKWADRLYVAPNDLPRVREASPGGLPVFSTSEISMQGMLPWGGYGANPMPMRLQREIADNPNLLGLRPYSEGVYEDLNKVVALEMLRNPKKTALDAVGDYAARYFGEATRESVKEAVRLMEANMEHTANAVQGEMRRTSYALDAVDVSKPWTLSHAVPKLDAAKARKAKALIDEAERMMEVPRRASWRFRLLRLRADIDCALANGSGECELAPLFSELADIYHVSNVTPPWLVPPSKSLWRKVEHLWKTCL